MCLPSYKIRGGVEREREFTMFANIGILLKNTYLLHHAYVFILISVVQELREKKPRSVLRLFKFVSTYVSI